MKLEDILESLNFTAPITWNNNVGSFTINDQQFVMSVRPANTDEQRTFTPFFSIPPKVGNVDFSAVTKDGVWTQDLPGLSGNTAMKVFSVVAQGVAEQVKLHGYNVLLCVAKRTSNPTGYQKRVDAYETIVERAARKAGFAFLLLSSTPNETVYIVYNYGLNDGIDKVKQHLINYYRTPQ